MRRRLFLQVYLTLLGIIVLFGALAVLGWWLTDDERPDADFRRSVGALLVELLPPPGATRAETDAALARLGQDFNARISVFGPEGELLGSLGRPLRAPQERPSGSRKGKGKVFALPLPDGRVVKVRPKRDDVFPTPAIGFLAALGILAFAVAVGAWPLARRLARRLERLQARVEALGAGDLAARVDVEGKDEIAALARSFNQAAERIQALVEAQRDTLAAASHELRSPLARIRMAVELLAENGDPTLRQRIERDIEDLDELIEEILLASRLSTLERPTHLERIDLQALCTEEAARAGATFEGGPATMEGEGRLLARLIRNLLDNAARHAPGSPIQVELGVREGHALLRVLDRGPGVPEAERERIFEPFYRREGRREDQDDDRGVGLGLSLVRQIARRHGGDVRCLPREGGGACFEVSLRIGEPDTAP
ncbi:MAG: HAMP domain-containing sensor histidine kinase [Rhodospirillales bacterium]|nr:HAMP domain-containing sensor histidine kinase [Rhodospirillales bacterium]